MDQEEMSELRKEIALLKESLNLAKDKLDLLSAESLRYKALYDRQVSFGEKAPGSFNLIDALTLNYQMANANFERLLGIRKTEIINKNLKDILSEGNYQTVMQCIENLKSQEIVITEIRYNNEGSEKINRETFIPVKNKDGQTVSISVYGTDITDYKNIEKRLLSTTKILELALKSAKAGAWSFDVLTGQIYWSEGMFDLLGMNIDGIIPSFEVWKEAIHPEDKTLADDSMKLAMMNRSSVNNDYRLITREGRIQWINSRAFGVFDDEGKLIQLIGICSDINRIKEGEAELNDKINQLKLANKNLEEHTYANQELKQFAYITSHQLQEPIRTVANFTRIIEEDYSELFDDIGLKHLDTIKEASVRMASLMDTLIDYSILGRNMILETVDCKILIDTVITDLNTLIAVSHAVIVVTEMPNLNAYKIELSQLFQNLIRNAIKFHKKDIVPKISISCEKMDDKWQFSVHDNGIGIDPVHFEKIFNIFQRLHVDETEYEGKGIGLAYCKKIVQLHHGEIWVESAKDKGSTFYFTIPLNS